MECFRVTLSMPVETAGLDKVESEFSLRKDEHLTEAFRVIEAGKIKLNDYLTHLIEANPAKTNATESSGSRKRPAEEQPADAVDADSSSSEEEVAVTETITESAE